MPSLDKGRMLHVYAHVDPGDAMKAARLQVLTTPVFRDWLRREARNAGVSVAELVRTRCERKPTGEEQAVAKLASHLHEEVRKARR